MLTPDSLRSLFAAFELLREKSEGLETRKCIWHLITILLALCLPLVDIWISKAFGANVDSRWVTVVLLFGAMLSQLRAYLLTERIGWINRLSSGLLGISLPCEGYATVPCAAEGNWLMKHASAHVDVDELERFLRDEGTRFESHSPFSRPPGDERFAAIVLEAVRSSKARVMRMRERTIRARAGLVLLILPCTLLGLLVSSNVPIILVSVGLCIMAVMRLGPAILRGNHIDELSDIELTLEGIDSLVESKQRVCVSAFVRYLILATAAPPASGTEKGKGEKGKRSS